jgi:hypothetical protein
VAGLPLPRLSGQYRCAQGQGYGAKYALRDSADDQPAAEDVFRFVATDHFQNHPKWDPAVEQMTPASPGPMAQGATRAAGSLRLWQAS